MMEKIQNALIYIVEHEDEVFKFMATILAALTVASLGILGYVVYAHFEGTLGVVH